MLVNIITCHDVYNAGASLQAYALVSYLKTIGHDTRIIDYKPVYFQPFSLFQISNPRYKRPIIREAYIVAKLPGRIKKRLSRRKKEYDHFTSTLPLTKRYKSFDALKADPPYADVYIAGSDQIWNTLYNTGRDPAFYLDFVPSGRVKASYAASFALDRIDEEWKLQVKKWLRQIDYISVRETTGLEILKSLGISHAVQVCDPVFLLTRAQWQSFNNRIKAEKPYIFVCDFEGNKQIEEYCRQFAQRRNLKIYSLLANRYCDRCFDQYGPEILPDLIANAEFVISNSFHVTAFSIIFEKKFIVFERKERINTRINDLLDMLGLNLCYSRMEHEEIPDIDYEQVHDKLQKIIISSKDFINEVLLRANHEGHINRN